MVVIDIRCTHEPVVRHHPDPNYEGYMVSCTCGWVEEAFDPPGSPMWFRDEETARSVWWRDHGHVRRR